MTDSGPNIVSTPGGGIAGKVAKAVADASVYSKQRLSDHTVRLAVRAFTDATNHVSDEVRGVFGDVFKTALEHPDMPEEFKPLLKELAHGRGQAWALIAGSALGFVLGGALQESMHNAWAPVSQAIIEKAPNGLLDPSLAAQAYVRDLMGNGESYEEAARGGIRSWRMDIMRKLAQNRPDLTAILRLYQMGSYDQNAAIQQMVHLGFSRDDALRLTLLAITQLTPEQAAEMWNRDILTMEQGKDIAKAQGMGGKDFERLTLLGGMPPSPEELGEALRRGFIDEKRYNLGIVQGPIRKEWFDVLRKLQYSRMSTVDAADAVNQGHLTLEQGRQVAAANGLVPEDFNVLIESAGQPPGIQFATEALNRGFIGEADFRTMFLESRIKNRYLPLMLKMRTNLIPQETVRLLYRNGVYSKQDTLHTLMAHGFSEQDSASLLALEETRQDDTTKELSRAQIVDMYDQQILDEATARELLKALGYADSNVELMIALAQIKRAQRFINAAVTRVRSSFLTGKIDDQEASRQLDSLGIPPDQRDELLTIWEIDASTVSKTLTPAQIRQAAKKNLISEEDAIARLVSQGYDETDASLYLQLTA